jgi:gamma-glutamyltranspeptidase / glutathione hydrolase
VAPDRDLLGWDLPYPSRRQPTLGDDVIATSQPLATQAGMAMYEAGGNAVDAALAAAIALTVVEPTANGIGGDAFAIVHDRRAATSSGDGPRVGVHAAGPDAAIHGLNASGRAPAGLDAERLRARPAMPVRSWDAVTVPGAVSAWVALSERFGRLPFDRLFGPAVRFAREGFPVSPLTARAWSWSVDALGARDDFAAAFLPGGRAP